MQNQLGHTFWLACLVFALFAMCFTVAEAAGDDALDLSPLPGAWGERLVAKGASQEVRVSKQRFEPKLRAYFLGEKLSGWWWGGAGLIGAGVGVGLLFVDSPLAYGMAFPLMIVGGLQVLIGIWTLASMDARVARYVKAMDKDTNGFYSAEVKRMELVVLAFKLIKWVEIGLLATGVGLVTGGMLAELPVIAGVGMGLMITGFSMLLLDLFAQQRAGWYMRALRMLPSLQVAPANTSGIGPTGIRLGLAWQGSF